MRTNAAQSDGPQPHGWAPAKARGDRPLTVFEEDWWLDAVTDGAIERAEVYWDSALVGMLPYLPVRKGMMRKLEMPPYTRRLTPRISAPGSKDVTRMSNTIKIIGQLYEKIGEFDAYHTVISDDRHLIFAYQMNGFKLNPKITFSSAADVPIDALTAAMDHRPRNIIKTAQRQFEIEQHFDLDRFRRLREAAQAQDYNDYRIICRLMQAVESHDAGVILSAVDDKGQDVATAVLVWDSAQLYYFMASRSASPEANKASPLVFYESIKLAKSRDLAFDADGYASIASALSLQKWGLDATINLNVRKGGIAYEMLKPLKDKILPPPF